MRDDSNNKNYSGTDGDKVAIFIDTDGIHFVQTPGITYAYESNNDSKNSNVNLQDIITKYNQKSSDPTKKISLTDVEPLVNRHKEKKSYLNYLQARYLL